MNSSKAAERRPKGTSSAAVYPIDSLDVALILGAVVHIFVCPFNKVEESFNVQAIHDLLYFRTDLHNYDHLEFSGVVPRSFIGALVLSILTAPFAFVVDLLGISRLYTLIAARCVLATLFVVCLRKFRLAAGAYFQDRSLPRWIALLTLSQFHIMFYCSRFLPNVFALVLSLLSNALWLGGNSRRSLAVSAFIAVVFRCDFVVFALPQLLMLLYNRTLSFSDLLRTGTVVSLASIVLSVVIDSFFWGYMVWPELSVLWFNTLLGGSVQYGTSPPSWYLSSALPRALLSAPLYWLPALLQAPPAALATRLRPLVDTRAASIAIPSFASIALYSCLGHKELRFLFPLLPLLNVLSARGISRLLRSDKLKSSKRSKIWKSAVYLSLGVNLCLSCCFLYVSSLNYPGGVAMQRLHALTPTHSPQPQSVYIDNVAAISGACRFLEDRQHFVYDKTENAAASELLHYDWLLHEQAAVDGFKQLDTIHAFAGLELHRSPPFITIRSTPQISILGRLPSALLLSRSAAVVVFSKSYCPHCRRVKKLLEELDVSYRVIELNEMEDGSALQAELLRLTGQRTVPNVFVAGTSIGGADATFALHQQQKLLPMLRRALEQQ